LDLAALAYGLFVLARADDLIVLEAEIVYVLYCMYLTVCTTDEKIRVGPGQEATKTKHGIDFETTRLVFDDPFCVSFIGRGEGAEERWHTIGMIEDIIVMVVAHTYRVEGSDEVIRIISSRPATSHERKLYDNANR
jgi:uncharacterized DUF497 family protein